MVIDRDYRDEQSVRSLQQKQPGRLFIWPIHEVENILLVPAALLKVLNANGIESLQSTQQVDDALLEAAKSCASLFVIQMSTYRINNHAFPDTVSSENGAPKDEKSLLCMMAARLKRRSEAYEIDHVQSIIREANASVSACLVNGSWRVILPGKEILDALRKRYISNLKYDLLKEQIIARMVEDNIVATEVEVLVTFLKH